MMYKNDKLFWVNLFKKYITTALLYAVLGQMREWETK